MKNIECQRSESERSGWTPTGARMVSGSEHQKEVMFDVDWSEQARAASSEAVCVLSGEHCTDDGTPALKH